MRIGIDCRPMQDGFIAGIGYYIYNLLIHVSRVDTKNEYVLFFNDFRESFLNNVPLFEYENFQSVKKRVPNIFLSGVAGTSLSTLLPIEKLIGRVDIFHATNFLLPYCEYAKSILTIYDLSILKFKKAHPLARRIIFSRDKLAYSAIKCNAIIACSNTTKEDIAEVLNVNRDKIKVIYEAVSPDFKKIDNAGLLQDTKKKYLLPERYLLYIGTLEPRKNICRLIEAYNILDKRLSREFNLILVGGRGWYCKDVFRAIKRLTNKNRVRYLGYIARKDLPVLLNAAEAFVYPSLYEGFGLPPLEAMACGVPTLVSDVSCFSEVVGDAALKVNPYSVDDIAEGIYRIITDNNLRDSLRKKGLERVKDFSWEKTAKETLALYEEVYSGKR